MFNQATKNMYANFDQVWYRNKRVIKIKTRFQNFCNAL